VPITILVGSGAGQKRQAITSAACLQAKEGKR
jgi:hypothetical protein